LRCRDVRREGEGAQVLLPVAVAKACPFSVTPEGPKAKVNPDPSANRMASPNCSPVIVSARPFSDHGPSSRSLTKSTGQGDVAVDQVANEARLEGDGQSVQSFDLYRLRRRQQG
jgi:hypothetical protein